jgi:hypothetical protein
VLRWLAERLAHLRPARRAGQGGTPPLPLEVRLYRVRDVYRAAAALICLGRWIHRIPA